MIPTARATALIQHLQDTYGAHCDSTPTGAQWRRVLERSDPLTLVNFFKLRQRAVYPNPEEGISGQEAFSRYTAQSIPAVARAGGSFLFVGQFGGTFIGPDEEWDLVAIASYPSAEALVRLFEDPTYAEVYPHRTAACAAQKVLLGTPMPS